MKLLLTPAGITNESIEKALAGLVGRDLSECRMAFIPTAANVEDDTLWLEDDINNLKATGVKLVMADIEKLPRNEWLPILKSSQIICIGGGNTYHLLKWVRQSGLIDVLPGLLKDRVYMGISSGSMIVGPDVKSNEEIYSEEVGGKINDLSGLKYVPFAVVPHLNSPDFKKARLGTIEEFAKTIKYPVYALDDNTAVTVVDGEIKVITEEGYKIFN